MAEKRNIKRHLRRLHVKFGVEAPSRLGFTGDVSVEGMFIKTTNVSQPGTKLRIELTLPDKTVVVADGIVMWAKKVPPQVIHLVKKAGMGVRLLRFHSNQEAYLRLFNS